MKKTLLILLLLLSAAALPAAEFVNLTPAPRQMTVGTGRYVLPATVTVSVAEGDAFTADVEAFAHVLGLTTGREVRVTDTPQADIVVRQLPADDLEPEGYRLAVTADGVVLSASTADGCWYGLQTIRKLLPANVMAGVADPAVTDYSMPVVDIDDAPRFAYRGFMLDVSRHFFSVEEVKRMLDIMAAYKMNRFHWHLTDDQGWRVEIKKYPLLTTVGSIAPDALIVDRQYGSYWLNSQYGPYYYTQDELRDVVAYAAERHIQVVPEVDMPGHFVAAMASYPAFSCTPAGTHTVWSSGGVSGDVLNVANPDAVQFCKDVLTEIMDIFPGELIHIGGDECPTSAWEGNAQCKALVAELGLANFRQLQSQFIGWMGDHVAQRGRRLVVWNEAISAGGADVNLVASHDPLVMSWYPADQSALQAANLGLDNIVTPYGPYYINRKQWSDGSEPQAAGDGTDNLERVYAYVPVPSNVPADKQSHYTGVQGTFWCEYVGTPDYLEYLALPRLLAVAESGWTPAGNKNFKAFVERVRADTTLFNYGHYSYGRHYMTDDPGSKSRVMPVAHTAQSPHWYRLVNRCTDDARRGRCIELLRQGSPLIASNSGKGAQAGRLWTADPAAEGADAYDWQLWGFEPDPAGSGHYAIVCKGSPAGSVNPKGTAESTSGRWTYDNAAKHYDFILGDQGYGADGTAYYYSIRSTRQNLWMNSSLAGQGFAVNLYNNPSDGNSGLWTFHAMNFDPSEEGGGDDVPSAFTGFAEGEVVRISNAVEGFDGCALYDRADRTGNYLRHTTDRWVHDAWVVQSASEAKGGTQTVVLRNVGTSRAIRTAATTAQGHAGHPVTIATTSAAKVAIHYDDATDDYTLAVSDKYLFPIPATSTNKTLAGIVSAGSTNGGSNAIRPQGNAWHITPVAVITWQCTDAQGNDLGTYQCSATRTDDYVCEAPAIDGYTLVAINGSSVADALPTLAAPLADTLLTAVYADATAIQPLPAQPRRCRLFDLFGRRVPNGAQGIVVTDDGQKFYVK